MVNQDLLNRLLSLIKQGLITVDNIVNQDYKAAAQEALSAQ
jgi:hypothetical protein